MIKQTPSKIQAFPPNFLLRKFSVKGQFLQKFGTQNSAKTVHLQKIFSTGN